MNITDIPSLRQGRDYIDDYNNRRSHQRIAHQIPLERYRNAARMKIMR